MSRVARRATNISLDPDLIDQARALDINVSRACERGLVRQIAETRAKRWREENAEAIESWNRYVEEHGLPFSEYRTF